MRDWLTQHGNKRCRRCACEANLLLRLLRLQWQRIKICQRWSRLADGSCRPTYEGKGGNLLNFKTSRGWSCILYTCCL